MIGRGKPRLVHVGVAADERVIDFAAAAVRAGYAPPVVVSYDELWRRTDRLAELLGPDAILRLDSPSDDFDAWRALAGVGATELESLGQTPVDAAMLDSLRDERGLFWRSDLAALHRQTYAGLIALSRRAATLATRQGARVLNDVEAIEICCDKTRCHQAMIEMGMAVPAAIVPDAPSFEALLAAMDDGSLNRVFVKPRYGSAAAGIVALARSDSRISAWSAAEIGSSGAIYSVKTVKRFDDLADIRILVEAVLKSDAHVEAWIAKAGVANATCDLRLLMIAGQPQHCVLRSAPAPMTNLHLGGKRLAPEQLIDRLAPGVWDRALTQAQSFARRFPSALQLSFDIAIHTSLRSHHFLEANVFGDLLRRVTFAGRDPYEAQLAALPTWVATERRAA